MSFDSFSLHPRVRAGIPPAFVSPTPIQSQAIPFVLEGRDVLGLAQTGTGKTAAFALPILNRLFSGKRGAPRALVLAPTRELAEQIRESFEMLASQTGLRVTSIYGGVSMNAQVQRLRQGVDIIVACPGRLLDHIESRTVDLRSIEVLVLDEADHMFDMGFLPTVRRILSALPKERQSLLFSATMPREVKGLALDVLRDPAQVQVGDRTPVKTVAHALYTVSQDQKTDLLLRLLQGNPSGSVLVFTRTKHRAKKLGNVLAEAGYAAASLQGNLSQNKRQEALNGFRDGSYQILVATDIAARGIDVASVSHVINYDIPDTVEAYTHRIGRTGRAERTGDAFTFVTREDEAMVRSIERVLGAPIERKKIDGLMAIPLPQRSPERARISERVEVRNERPRQARHGESRSDSGGRRPRRPRGQWRGPRRGQSERRERRSSSY